MTHVTVRNGLTLAYTVAAINAALVLVTAFGISITQDQQAAIVAFVNISLLLAARVLHMPEKTPTGTIKVDHFPVLVETPTLKPEPIVTPLVPVVVSPETPTVTAPGG